MLMFPTYHPEVPWGVYVASGRANGFHDAWQSGPDCLLSWCQFPEQKARLVAGSAHTLTARARMWKGSGGGSWDAAVLHHRNQSWAHGSRKALGQLGSALLGIWAEKQRNPLPLSGKSWHWRGRDGPIGSPSCAEAKAMSVSGAG